MLESERQVFSALMNYACLQCAQIPEDRWSEQPAPGVNTPEWTIGHLAVCNDYTLGLLGVPSLSNDNWHAKFGPTSDPALVGSRGPTKIELLAALESGYEAIVNSLHLASSDLLNKPHTILQLRENYKTQGDLICVLMTGHVGLHLGQLAVWRKLAGLPRVNWPT